MGGGNQPERVSVRFLCEKWEVRGAWCVVRGAWCVVRGAWCVVRGAWCVVGSGQWAVGSENQPERVSVRFLRVTRK